ncbi:ead/Ea22-like family protein [Enterobacter hormaechei]|nr:ead/Ea22-like family protein [Enterobacter hormaechei]MCM7584517.1 ead/Ea22-like family protein [Enterobacter hormaechei]
MSNIDKQALRNIAAAAESAPLWHAVGVFGEVVDPANPEWKPVHDFCKTFTAERVLALLDELEAKDQRIAELEAREVNGRFPLPKDTSQGWKIDPEFISKIQDAIGYDEECQCWEGSPSMEMVEAVLIAAAAIKMDERG